MWDSPSFHNGGNDGRHGDFDRFTGPLPVVYLPTEDDGKVRPRVVARARLAAAGDHNGQQGWITARPAPLRLLTTAENVLDEQAEPTRKVYCQRS